MLAHRWQRVFVVGSGFAILGLSAPSAGATSGEIDFPAPELLSRTSDGSSIGVSVYPAGISGNGGVALFLADGPYSDEPVSDHLHSYARNRVTGETTVVDVRADESSTDAAVGQLAVSPNGRFAAFSTFDSLVVAGDHNDTSDVFLRDLRLGTTTLVSASVDGGTADGGGFAPTMVSNNGRYVTFISSSDDLADGLVLDSSNAVRRDMLTGDVELISVGYDGQSANGITWAVDQSADGRLVVLISDATNLTRHERDDRRDVFLLDRSTGVTAKITDHGRRSRSASWSAEIDDDGASLVFSTMQAMVAEDTNGAYDIYRYDVASGVVELLSTAVDGGVARGRSLEPHITGDGRLVSYRTAYPRQQVEDARGCRLANIVVRDLEAGTAAVVGRDAEGRCPFMKIHPGPMSDDGFVTFQTEARLHADDTDFSDDLYGVQVTSE